MSQTWVAMSERCKYGSHGRKESGLSRRLQISVVDSPVVKDEQHPFPRPPDANPVGLLHGARSHIILIFSKK
jgi:hypothetical protein